MFLEKELYVSYYRWVTLELHIVFKKLFMHEVIVWNFIEEIGNTYALTGNVGFSSFIVSSYIVLCSLYFVLYFHI